MNDICPTFSWSEVDGAQAYELVVYSTDSSEPLPDQPVMSIRLPARVQSWTPPVIQCLEAGGNYAWAVRAERDSAVTSWSEAALFAVIGAPGPTEVRQAIRVLREFLEQRRMAGAEPSGRTTDSAAATRPTVRRLGRHATRVLTDDTTGPGLVLSAITVPSAFSLSIDQDLDLGGSIFQESAPLLHSGVDSGNTALGRNALANVSFDPYSGYGAFNTAVGENALLASDGGRANVAVGNGALRNDTNGWESVAVGYAALSNVSGVGGNVAVGYAANSGGSSITFGNRNTAVGFGSMWRNGGSRNTSIGANTLTYVTSGSDNIALGNEAGSSLGYGVASPSTSMSHNIFIGNSGGADEEQTIRVGDSANHSRTFIAGIHSSTLAGSAEQTVCVDDAGQLGPCSVSSRQFKQDVAGLQASSPKLLKLRPVTFRYREGVLGGPEDVRFGLIAEEVAEVFPELVLRDENGNPFGVRYDLLSVLLLAELQAQHEAIARQKETALDHESAVAELAAIRKRLTALEEPRASREDGKPWHRWLFGRRGNADPP